MNSNAKEIEELKDGWVRCRSKSNPGRQYFFNRKTGKSSWTQPQIGEKQEKKTKKKKSPIQNQQKPQPDGARNKSVKRKSNEGDAGCSKKKPKNETPEKPGKKVNPKQYETRSKLHNQTKSPVKRLSHNDSKLTTPPQKKTTPSNSKLTTPPQKKTTPSNSKLTTPPQKKTSPSKATPSKNSASKRLSQLRSQLSVEAQKEIEREKDKTVSNQDTIETSVRPRNEVPSPNISEFMGSTTTKSPINDSLHSIPSPSQFFAANKIISSMKAQLPEEYCTKEKPKDTFADIEQGICSQITEYYVIKHPSTPPQFSEASKLVSAIKSKLSYSPKDVKSYPSAQERMEALRASLSGEIDERDLREESNNDSVMSQPAHSVTSQGPCVQERCEAMEVEDVREPVEVPQPSTLLKDTVPVPISGQVVLVVDTNIFIHELDFIKTVLNAHIKGYSEQPTLLVPWRVINELDRLKDNNNGNGAVCKRARAAMDYLYKSLPENNRIKGQSLRDANSHIYPCELPDDEILNCALQQAERGRNVLLLSNDRNLCNKASVNGVRRVGLAELKTLVTHRPAASPDLLSGFQQCRRTVYQLLANILENEMRAKYNNLWLHVVYRPPPWELIDVLQCLLKHWVAVFSEVFPRIEHLIADLKGSLERIEGKDPTTVTESEVNHFKELSVEVAHKCQIIPEYMELAKLASARLASPSGTDDDERARRSVVAAFEALWNVMSSYCAKLATALGVAHGVADGAPAGDSLPRLAAMFPRFNGCVHNFVLTVDGVLKTEDMSSLDEKITRLEAAFRECLQLTRHDGHPSKEHLRTFCLTNRSMLQEAVSKFSQLRQLLDACKAKLEVPA